MKNMKRRLKKVVMLGALAAGIATGANAQASDAGPGVATNKPASAGVDKSLMQKRVAALNSKMQQDLRLNNFQSAKLRAINAQVVAKMMEAEMQYANDPDQQDKACRGVCKQRDNSLADILSTDQYTKYYGSREAYYKLDRSSASNQ
jgi:hypothetical protein